jgi:hypothetical protein
MRVPRLNLDEPVAVHEESGRIVIARVRRKEYNLTELLNGISLGARVRGSRGRRSATNRYSPEVVL